MTAVGEDGTEFQMLDTRPDGEDVALDRGS